MGENREAKGGIDLVLYKMMGAKGTKVGKYRETKEDIALVLYRIMGAKGTKDGKNRESKGDTKIMTPRDLLRGLKISYR